MPDAGESVTVQLKIRCCTEPELYEALRGLNKRERSARLRSMALIGLGMRTVGASVALPEPRSENTLPAGLVDPPPPPRAVRRSAALAGMDFD